MPSTNLPQAVASAFAAVNVEEPQCLELFRPLYDDGVVFRDPLQRVEGLDGFMHMNARLLRQLRFVRVDVTAVEGTDEDFFLTWTMAFTPKALKRSLNLEGVTHAKGRNGKVVYHRDYWDLAELVASFIPGASRMLRIALRRIV